MYDPMVTTLNSPRRSATGGIFVFVAVFVFSAFLFIPIYLRTFTPPTGGIDNHNLSAVSTISAIVP